MNESRDYYYKILGLKPGATPNEIKTAYRRLVKLYHPDKDQSADTAIMYKEVRIAYEKLLNWDYSSVADINTATKAANKYATNTATKTGTGTTSSRVSSGTEWTSEDWDKWEKEHYKEVSKIRGNKFLNLILAFAIAILTPIILCDNNLVLITIIFYHVVSWFYYYFNFSISSYSPSTWPLIIKIPAGALYGVALVIMLSNVYTMPVVYFVAIGISAALSAYVLMDVFPIRY